MDLKVNDDAVKSLVAKAIVDSLTPEMRQKLITDAVIHTLSAPDDSNRYGSKRSPLQQAFDYAVSAEARKFADAQLATDENFQAQLRSLFADVAAKLFATETREKLVDSIAGIIQSALTKDRY